MTDLGGFARPGSANMQIGTAYYNLKRYGQAMQAFKEATAFSDYRGHAKQWVVFVSQEIERERVVRGDT